MRWMEQRFGGMWTVLCHLGLAAMLLFFGQGESALVIVGLMTMVISYSYFEQELPGRNRFWLGTLAVGFSAGTSALLLGVWGFIQGQGHLQLVFEATKQRWMDVTTVVGSGASALAQEQVLRLMPGVLLSCWIAALMMALLLEPMGRRGRASQAAVLSLNFRVPDVYVLVTIAALLGAFYPYQGFEVLRQVAENVLLVCGFLFLIQGFAVVTTFVNLWRVPLLARLALFMVLFIYFYVVAVLGFSDYWMDYRRRFLMRKKEK